MKEEQAGGVRARPSQTGDELERNRVEVDAHDDDWDRCRRFLGGTRREISGCKDDIHLETDQLGREVREPIDLSLGVPELDGEVLAVDVAQLAQPLLKGLEKCRSTRVRTRQVSDPVHLAFLRGGGKRSGQEEED